MANRYWVGGTAAWDGTAGTKWALTSGGAGGQAIPTSADDVFFSAASGTVTCTISSGNTGAKSINCTGFTGTFAGSGAISVSGNITLDAGMTVSYIGGITIIATATIISAGKTLASFTVNGVGITVTLGDAFTAGSAYLFTVLAGTFDTANYSVTGGSFSTSGASTRSVLLGTSTVTFSGTTFWTVTGVNPLTTDFTSSTIVGSGFNSTFAGGGVSYGTVNFAYAASSSTFAITGSNTFNVLEITPTSINGINKVTFAANQTITTLTASVVIPSRRIFLSSSAFGTPRTLTVSTLTSLVDIDFQDIVAAGAASWTSGTRFGDCKGNTGITFDTPKTVYWNLSGGASWGSTGWATTPTGTPLVDNFPLAQDIAEFTDAGSVTGTISINNPWNLPTIDMSARTTAMTLSTTPTVLIYGDWINGLGTTLSGTGQITFSSRGNQNITSNAKTFTQGITINSLLGTVTLQDALTTSRAATGAVTLTNGTLDLNGNTLTLSATSTATFLTSTGTKNLTFNGGSIIIAASGTTAFNNIVATGFTTTAGTGIGSISLISASAKTFVGGGSTFNCTLNQGGAGALTITGSNTFNDIANTTQPASVLFTAGTTSTFTNFSLSGTAGNLITIGSVTASGHTLSKASNTVNANYLSISRSTATGGAIWNALNSTNNGFNTGWSFSATIYSGNIFESSTFTDNIISIIPYSVFLNEAAVSADTVNTTALLILNVNETIAGTDLAMSFVEFYASATELTSATDEANLTLTYQAMLEETTTITDSAISIANLHAFVNDLVAGTDEIIIGLNYIIEINEIVAAMDAEIAGCLYESLVLINMTITDNVIGAYLWNPIDDNQTANWQNVNDAQTPGWSLVQTPQSQNWTDV
jgi:hypothetical protein